MKTVVYGNASISVESVQKRMPKGSVVAGVMTPMGKHLDCGDALKSSAHVYAPLSGGVKRAVVLHDYPALTCSHFFCAWIGALLIDMGPDGEVWFERPRLGFFRWGNRKKIESYLRTHLPSAHVRSKRGFFILQHSPGIMHDLERLKTVYPAFHGAYPDFLSVFAKSWGEEEPTEQTRSNAMNTFLYSLFGAGQKGYVTERIVEDLLAGNMEAAVDFGGGMGLIAAEIASKDSSVLVVDHNERHMNVVGPWIADRTGADVSFMEGKLEGIPEMELPGNYDMVSFFGCLLYADRGVVQSILEKAMELLCPGGILLIHENPRETAQPDNVDYNNRFPADELYGYLDALNGEPFFYNIFSAKQVPFESVRNKLIMAAVRKPL